MDKTEFTLVQQQVIKSIEKSIEKDLKTKQSNKDKTTEKVAKLEAEIDELRGILKANEELLDMNVESSLKALKTYTGMDSWTLVEGELVNKSSSFEDTLIEGQKKEEKGEKEEKEAKPEEVSVFSQKKDSIIEDSLPWEEGDLPFKEIFPK